MKKLTSILLLTALTAGALAFTEAPSFAKGHCNPSRHSVSVRKHKKGKRSVVAQGDFEARKSRKRGRKGRPNPSPSPAVVG